MSILGILITYVGILMGSIIRSKGRKDHTNTFKLNIIIISIKKKGDNNFNDFNNNEDYKNIKILKLNKYYGEWEKFNFWLLQFII